MGYIKSKNLTEDEIAELWRQEVISSDVGRGVTKYRCKVTLYGLGLAPEETKNRDGLEGSIRTIEIGTSFNSISKLLDFWNGSDLTDKVGSDKQLYTTVNYFVDHRDINKKKTIPVFSPVGEGVYYVYKRSFGESERAQSWAKAHTHDAIATMLGKENVPIPEMKVTFLGYEDLPKPIGLGFKVNKNYDRVIGEFTFQVDAVVNNNT